MKNIFTDTKTYYGFQNKEVSDETLHEIYALIKNNATSFNCQPLRHTQHSNAPGGWRRHAAGRGRGG